MQHFNYLALGDSYTIGEQVSITDSFPYQAVQHLRKLDLQHTYAGPEIIAKTGWTTDELLAAIQSHTFLPFYDVVTLLIGVNNQYRGYSLNKFSVEFEQLVQLAIRFAGSENKNVFVFSIPDWGLTPFATGKDHQKISAEIDTYNDACQKIAEKYHCRYIDITHSQREDAADVDFLAPDMLHPSGKEYAKWALRFANAVIPT